MSLALFLAVVGGGIAATFASRSNTHALRIVAAVALTFCLLAAVTLAPGTSTVGDTELTVTPYVRAWLVAASGGFLFLHLVAMASAWQRNLPLAMLAVLATSGVALSLTDPAAALLAAATGALSCLLGVLLLPLSKPAIRVAADGLRVAAVAAGLGVLATGWVDSSVPIQSGEPVTVAFALMAAALVVRLGAFPVLAPAARVTQTAPLLAAPILLAWVPAILGAIALSWHEQRFLSLGTGVGLTATLAIALGVVTLALCGLAAVVQDDLGQIVGYSTIQDLAFVLLAFAAPADASATVRGWLIVFALTKSAAFGLVLTLSAAYGTRLATDLQGWARRSPLLGVALVTMVIATYGWPGMLPWEARAAVLRPALGVAAPAVMLIALLPLVAFGRLALVGVREQGIVVRRGFGSRPAPVPFTRPRRLSISFEPRDVLHSSWVAAGVVRDEARAVFVFVRLAWRLNRAPAAAALVVVLALLPLALAFRSSDVRTLARTAPVLATPAATATSTP